MEVAPREYWLGFPNFGTKLVLGDLLKFHFGKSSYFSSDGNMGRGRPLQEEKLYFYLYLFFVFVFVYAFLFMCCLL